MIGRLLNNEKIYYIKCCPYYCCKIIILCSYHLRAFLSGSKDLRNGLALFVYTIEWDIFLGVMIFQKWSEVAYSLYPLMATRYLMINVAES